MTSVMVDGDGDRIAAESWEKNRKSRLRPPLTERTLQEKLYCQVCIIARYKPLSKWHRPWFVPMTLPPGIPYDEARPMLPEMCLKYWCCTAAVTTNRNSNF
jgi:hypothetical protein